MPLVVISIGLWRIIQTQIVRELSITKVGKPQIQTLMFYLTWTIVTFSSLSLLTENNLNNYDPGQRRQSEESYVIKLPDLKILQPNQQVYYYQLAAQAVIYNTENIIQSYHGELVLHLQQHISLL